MLIYDILNAIQTNSLIIILIAVSYALYKHRKTSFVVTILLLASINLSHMLFQIVMNMLFISPFYDGVIYEISIRLWYIFYAGTDFLAAYLIYSILKTMNLKPNAGVHLVAYSFGALGLIQTARYADIFIFSSSVFEEIYKLGIPFINTFVLLISVSGVVLDARKKREL